MIALLLTWLALSAGAQASPVLDYERMEQLKSGLVSRVMEVEVTLKPAPDADPSMPVRLTGQAVCVSQRDGKTAILTSQFLVDNAARITARTAGDLQAPGTPEAVGMPAAVEMKVARYDPLLAVAFLAPADGTAFRCKVTRLATAAQSRPGDEVFSVDNPAGPAPNVFWGRVDGNAEPPLERFLLTSTGLPLGYPLFTSDQRLVALNLRPYTTTSALALSVPAPLLRLLFSPLREQEAPSDREGRRDYDTL